MIMQVQMFYTAPNNHTVGVKLKKTGDNTILKLIN